MSNPVRKGFSQALFDKNDGPARDASHKLCLHLGVSEIVDNPDKYGIDMLGKVQGHTVLGIEVEVKYGWRGGDFPFDTMHLPERKEKFCKKDMAVVFVILSKDMKRAAIFDKHTVLNSKKVEVPNRFVRAGELFFDIPLSEVTLVDLENMNDC